MSALEAMVRRWEHLRQKQAELDNRIITEKGLEDKLTIEELVEGRILALRVELAEYANETRCFKFWSNKGPAERERRLDEAADCLHFYLSLANHFGVDTDEMADIENFAFSSPAGPLVRLFNATADALESGPTFYGHGWLEESLERFLQVVKADGHTMDELEAAYYAKNKVNHERQDTGY